MYGRSHLSSDDEDMVAKNAHRESCRTVIKVVYLLLACTVARTKELTQPFSSENFNIVRCLEFRIRRLQGRHDFGIESLQEAIAPFSERPGVVCIASAIAHC